MAEARDPLRDLKRAYDEARFGAERTLNLRDSLPTPDEAVARLEPWLRQRQVERVKEVLIITGRGAGSAGGVSPVRVAVVTRLALLQRQGIVEGVRQHTAGSYLVRLAPPRARRGADTPAAVPPPALPSLAALPPAVRHALRNLAECELAALGVRQPEQFVEQEMLRTGTRLAAALPPGEGTFDDRLLLAIERELARCEGE